MPPPVTQENKKKEEEQEPNVFEFLKTNQPPNPEPVTRTEEADDQEPDVFEFLKTNAPTRQQMIQEPRTDRLPIGAEDLQTPVAPLIEGGDMTLEEHMEILRRDAGGSPTASPAWGIMGPPESQPPLAISGAERPLAEGMDRPSPLPLYQELQARKGELKKWRGALRKYAPGGVARAKAKADEQRGWEEKAMPMVGSIGGTVVGALAGGFLGNIPGAVSGARTGMMIGGGLGAAGGFSAGKELSGQGSATSGEMMRELALGAVIPTVKVGRGIIKTALGEGAKIGGASEIGQQLQSMLDEGHALSMSPGMVIKRNMYAAGFGGILGGIAGRKIPKGVLKETSREASRVLELQMEVLESKILKAQKLKGAKGKPRGETLRWQMKHKQAKADYDFFLKNFDLFSDPAKLEKHGARAVRISQTLATGVKKQDYWQRLVKGMPGEEDIAEGVLMDAAKGASARARTASEDKAAVKAAFEEEEVSLAERVGKLKDVPDSTKTKLISKFHPLKALEGKLRVAAGMTRKPIHDIAAKFETLAGSFGKARGHLMDFDRAVTDRVRKLKGGKKKTLLLRKPSFKENESDFNQYMFWHRTKDRLLSDKRASDKIAAIEAEIKEVKKVPQETSRRFEAGAEFRVKEEEVYLKDLQAELKSLKARPTKQVGDYTLERVDRNIRSFAEEMGPERYAGLAEAGLAFQQHLGTALKRQVESGRLSRESFNRIKADTGFYAPFTPKEYADMFAEAKSGGLGGSIHSTAAYANRIKGISAERLEDMKFASILGTGREKVFASTVSAETNYRLQELKKVLDLDENKVLSRKLEEGEAVRDLRKYDEITILEGGRPVRYEVSKDVGRVINGLGAEAGKEMIESGIRATGRLFRAGATAYNIPFQIKNFFADMHSAAFMSDYGIKGSTDPKRLAAEVATFGWDYGHAVLSAVSGQTRWANRLYRESLDANVLRSTMKDLTEKETVRGFNKLGAPSLWRGITDLSGVIEESFKILGVKRAIRTHVMEDVMEGGKKVSRKIQAGDAAELIRMNPEAITEIRRFMGSPDFARMGEWMEAVNTIFLFSNARLQGTLRDVSRAGFEGKKSAAAFTKLGITVGAPTVYNHLRNSTVYAEDYKDVPIQEKRNNFIVFLPWKREGMDKEGRTVGKDGSPIMGQDYVKIPKRGIVRLFAAQTEGVIDFYNKKDPDIIKRMAKEFMEDMSPLNIEGDNADERWDSLLSNLHPVPKTLAEVFGSPEGRSFYRHHSLMSREMSDMAPREQYTDRTPKAFISAAQWIDDKGIPLPDAFKSPIKLQAIVQGATAGLVTQFVPQREVEGRPEILNDPLLRTLTTRFLSYGRVENSEEWKNLRAASMAASTKAGVQKRESKAFVKDMLKEGRKAGEPTDESYLSVLTAMKEKYPVKVGGRFHDDSVTNEEMQDRIVDNLWMRLKGISPQISFAKSLSVEQRAGWIVNKLDSMESWKKQDGADSGFASRFLESYTERGVITEEVALEIVRLRLMRILEIDKEKK
tara:strand:- start:2142 stop:6662 length:4521 start_codon:yes stop_codon:yes gene_type:complete